MNARASWKWTGLALGLLSAGAAQASDLRCRAHEFGIVKSTTTIQLDAVKRGVYKKPAFYVYDWAHRKQFLFVPEDVVAYLENQIAEMRRLNPAQPPLPSDAWVDWIRKDLPLKENTDLYRYSLRSYSFAMNLQYLVAALLDSGHAAVDFWPIRAADSQGLGDEHDPVTIKRVDWDNHGQFGRTYCTTSDVKVLTIITGIMN